jgi:hypothetical protein
MSTVAAANNSAQTMQPVSFALGMVCLNQILSDRLDFGLF